MQAFTGTETLTNSTQEGLLYTQAASSDINQSTSRWPLHDFRFFDEPERTEQNAYCVHYLCIFLIDRGNDNEQSIVRSKFDWAVQPSEFLPGVAGVACRAIDAAVAKHAQPSRCSSTEHFCKALVKYACRRWQE